MNRFELMALGLGFALLVAGVTLFSVRVALIVGGVGLVTAGLFLGDES